MKYPLCMTLFLLTLAPVAQAAFFDDDAPASINAGAASFDPAFSATAPLSAGIVKTIAAAKKTIRIAARDFTSKPISEALLKAARAGIDVKVVLNRKTNLDIYSASRFLMTMDIIPHVTKGEDTLYEDYIVIDGQNVILGNVATFTDEEDEKKYRAGALTIRNVPELARQYMADWQSLWDDSEEMKPEKNK